MTSKALDNIESPKMILEKGLPFSQRHNDFYFSMKSGLEETRYVFLEANQLPSRFSISSKEVETNRPLVIAETGFGTGLNFLSTWRAWRHCKEPKRPLHFVSVEKYPLSKSELELSLNCWPELSGMSCSLIAQYPSLIQGQHQMLFDDGQVVLTLIFSDACDALSSYEFYADCWYLDGFSPSKNKSMWSDSLFNAIARHSHSGSTFSTFTAASIVRKGLLNAGFDVKKQSGYGTKREMLYGAVLNDSITSKQVRHKNNWSVQCSTAHARSETSNNRSDKNASNSKPDYDAIVVGAGLAGVSTARALAERGLSVAVIDDRLRPVNGASGQSQLAMYAKLPSEKNKVYEFITHCLGFSQRFYNHYQASDNLNEFWFPVGLLQLAWNKKERAKQEKFLSNITLPKEFIRPVKADEASSLSQLDITSDALWFEGAGWLEPKAYASSMLAHKNILQIYDQRVESISQCKSSLVWSANTAQCMYSAKYLIVANSNNARDFSQLNHLPTKPLRGQVTSIKGADLKTSATVVCGEGYLCPGTNNWHHFGATFDLDDNNEHTKDSDDLKNIESIYKWLPGWLTETSLDKDRIKSSAGLRCTTPDYLPIVGQAPIYEDMLNTFSKLRVGANSCNQLYGHYHENLFVNIGHGSKGLFSTPLAAQLITNQICGGVIPFSEQQRVMVSPARFIIKHLKQRRI